MSAFAYDVVVVGAGAAGLIAAREVARRGHSVALLEARDRFGGRLAQAKDASALASIELGGEFVHGRPDVTYALLREFGQTVIDDADGSFVLRDGRLQAAQDDPFEAARAVLASALERPQDESVDDLLARAGREPAAQAAAAWVRRLVGGFDAADPARASARAMASEWLGDASAGGAQSRPRGGYGELIAHLARSLDASGIDVRLATVVTAVSYGNGGVRVETRSADGHAAFEAGAAIVTVPHGVLAAEPPAHGAISFEPALPQRTRDAIGRIATGPVAKVILCFRDAFWERLDDGVWRDGAFFNAGGPFPTLWTQLPVRANTLVAWAGGPAAERFANATAGEWTELALASAEAMFGKHTAVREAFVAAYAHDWQRDPYARGAYTYVLVGGEAARDDLAQPVANRLWFAGEATATNGEGGTVAGALESGLRAARDVALCASRRSGAPS